MADYQDEFKRILDEEVGDYAARALGLLAQAIQAKGLILSEDLLKSLRTEVVGATAPQKKQLAEQLELDLASENLTGNEKLALIRKYHADVKQIEEEHKQWSEMNEKEKFATLVNLTGQALQTVADFEKIASDKQLAKLDKDKKQRLVQVESEYKAGKISKEQYEAQKATIEQNYDERTRQVKRLAAEKEKKLNIAQAIIAGTLAVIKVSYDPVLATIAAITAAAGVAKIIATPIPEFEKGGFFGRVGQGIKHYATGGRINPRAGVADVGQRHSGGGIRMVDGATGEHLGEWERGEAYMILSRDTYANNKPLIDELIDTSLHRGGASVRPRPGYYEDGGTFGSPAVAQTAVPASADSRELVQLLRETRDAIRALPSRQFIGWDQEDTAELEQRLTEREQDRQRGAIR